MGNLHKKTDKYISLLGTSLVCWDDKFPLFSEIIYFLEISFKVPKLSFNPHSIFLHSFVLTEQKLFYFFKL